jgi:hypothetical protein
MSADKKRTDARVVHSQQQQQQQKKKAKHTRSLCLLSSFHLLDDERAIYMTNHTEWWLQQSDNIAAKVSSVPQRCDSKVALQDKKETNPTFSVVCVVHF